MDVHETCKQPHQAVCSSVPGVEVINALVATVLGLHDEDQSAQVRPQTSRSADLDNDATRVATHRSSTRRNSTASVHDQYGASVRKLGLHALLPASSCCAQLLFCLHNSPLKLPVAWSTTHVGCRRSRCTKQPTQHADHNAPQHSH